jgi:hypothetical protein
MARCSRPKRWLSSMAIWRGPSASTGRLTATLSTRSAVLPTPASPRKGGIIKREYWQDYIPTKAGKFPDMDFVWR